MHVDDGLFLLERHVGQALAVRRPGGRDDRFARTQRRCGIHAVGVGHLQLEVGTALDHVGDAGGEVTGLAGEFFVHEVGDAMADHAILRGHHRQRHGAEFELCLGVEEAKANFVASIALWQHAAGEYRICAAPAHCRQVGEYRLGQRKGAEIDEAEQPAAVEVGAHDVGDAVGQLAFIFEDRDDHREARSARARDLDRELGEGAMGEACQRNGQQEAESDKNSGHRGHSNRGLYRLIKQISHDQSSVSGRNLNSRVR